MYLGMASNANALMCLETNQYGSSCPGTIGTIGLLEPANCAVQNVGEKPDVARRCYGTGIGKPTIAYRECAVCALGYNKKLSGTVPGLDCGDLKYYECVADDSATDICYDEWEYTEPISNENGCVSGERRWLSTDLHGWVGPIEYCDACQTGYKQVLHNVEINGCTNGPFEGAYCEDTRECTRARDCEGWVVGGAPVDPVKKPGLLKVITCTEAGKCTYHFRCDEDPGYYNGPASSNLGPTSCIKCPLYQGKYGDGHIRRLTRDTSITGCFIESDTTINATEGTFVLDSHCYY